MQIEKERSHVNQNVSNFPYFNQFSANLLKSENEIYRHRQLIRKIFEKKNPYFFLQNFPCGMRTVKITLDLN